MELDSGVRIGIQSSLGQLVRAVSLEELVATGDSYQIYLINYGRIGSRNYELVVQDEPQLAAKLELGLKSKVARRRRQK